MPNRRNVILTAGVSLALPLTAPLAAAASAPVAPSAPGILYVEEDPEVGYVMARLLSARGYAVTYTRFRFQALERLLAARVPYDLVICDPVERDPAGVELTRLAATAPAATGFLVISPYAREDLAHAIAEAQADYLAAPLSVKELAAVVRDALARPPRRI